MCLNSGMTALAEQRLDLVFAALADPTRRGIVARLTRGEATVGELAAPYRTSVQSISQHLKVLETAGLVSRSRVRQTRPCRLEPTALDTAMSWIEDARQLWSDRIDRLDEHLDQLQHGTRADRP
jgi:DNA-binding transcriptional ArsR family regulator